MNRFQLDEGENNVFDHINNSYFRMTKAEKRAADYVLEHRSEPKFMSISELAAECHVAEATISRFCRTLGFKGYNAFKLELARAGASNGAGMLSADELSAEVTDQDDIQTMCQKLWAVNMDALKQTLSFAEEDKIRLAADLLLQADNVYCMGQGSSLVLAEEAYSLFLTVSPKVHVVVDSHLQIFHTALMSERDVILYFSYSGATRDLIELEQTAAERGVKIILVSRFPKSPGAELATVVLKCGSNESPLRSGSVAARMAQLFVIDMLYTEVSRRSRERFDANRERIVQALTCKLL